MKKGMDTFNKGSRWMVGRESNLNLWLSNWTSGGLLRHLIQGPISQEVSMLEVEDVMLDTGQDWGRFSFELPIEIKMMIQVTPTSIISRGFDKLIWAGSPQGTFELRSAYKLAMGFEDFT